MTEYYETVVFLDGDDYRGFEQALYPESATEDLNNGYLLGAEDTDAAFDYLMQWEYGDAVDGSHQQPWGSADQTETFHVGGTRYVMAWHSALSYASLTRISQLDSADF